MFLAKLLVIAMSISELPKAMGPEAFAQLTLQAIIGRVERRLLKIERDDRIIPTRVFPQSWRLGVVSSNQKYEPELAAPTASSNNFTMILAQSMCFLD